MRFEAKNAYNRDADPNFKKTNRNAIHGGEVEKVKSLVESLQQIRGCSNLELAKQSGISTTTIHLFKNGGHLTNQTLRKLQLWARK